MQACNDSTILSDISSSLVVLGHSIRRVVYIKMSHCLLPLFHIDLALNENNQINFKINTLLYFAVVIENHM